MAQQETKTAWLCMQSWAGFRKTLVEVVGETPKRFRIRAITHTSLAGQYRSLAPGETTLVPRHALRFADGQ